MSQFVVDGQEIFESDARADADAEVFAVVKVPGCGVAGHFAIRGLLQHGTVPERVWNGDQAHGSVEFVAHFEHSCDKKIQFAFIAPLRSLGALFWNKFVSSNR